jgi:phosphatidylinositol kinase/protein kinase (PI-3  family)
MQQLFGLVNELLLQDQAAHARQLRIETYKVRWGTEGCGMRVQRVLHGR